MAIVTRGPALLLIGLLALAGCDDDGSAGAATGPGGGAAGDNPFGNSTTPPLALPDAGPLPNGAAGQGGEECEPLRLTVRDFTEEHPDFESYTGDGLDGIVADDLGTDQKPVYAHAGATQYTTGPDEFAQWYRDVDGVNMRVEVTIAFEETSPGVFSYDNGNFFPIDGRGFGNGPNPDHNFLFTTEAHTVFTYGGGEVFTFRGDDDLWVFVNGKLAVDLGGLHSQLEESIDFDAQAARLGIERGQTYPMDIFHAERHTTQSNFRIETTIDLSCVRNVSVD
jgi:fibro-slime domain-containing protein